MKIGGYKISIRKMRQKKNNETKKGLNDLKSNVLLKNITNYNLSNFDYEAETNQIMQIISYNPWLAASIRAINRNCIMPVLKVYRGEEEIKEHDSLNLLSKPFINFNYNKFTQFCFFYFLICGGAYVLKIRDGNGKIIALQPLPSTLIAIDSTSIQTQNLVYNFSTSAGILKIKREDLIIWEDYEYITSYYTGTSRVLHLLFSVLNKNLADRFNKSMLENGGEIKGIITTNANLTKEDIELFHQEMQKFYGGVENTGKYALIGTGATWQKIGQTMADMGYKDLMRISREEILAVLKVPEIELGLTKDVPYANAQAQRKLFWETTMMPLCDSFAQTLSSELLHDEMRENDLNFFFDYLSIPALQQDLKTKMETAILMQTFGYNNDTITQSLDIPMIEEKIDDEKTFFIKNKSIEKIYRDGIKNIFATEHRFSEKYFKTKLEKYFLNQRNEILDFFKEKYEMKGYDDPFAELQAFLFKNKGKWNDELLQETSKYFNLVNEKLVRKLLESFELKFYNNFVNIIKTSNHLQKIVDINETTNSNVLKMIKKAFDSGIQNQMSMRELAQKMMDETKSIYKLTANRAVTIARTETTSLANDIMTENFKENGIGKKEWLTAQDEVVRTFDDKAEFDHRSMDGVEVGLEDYFHVPKRNGGSEAIQYPGDMNNGSAGNVINCRCTINPK
jgi:HK97 family phage portal protein